MEEIGKLPRYFNIDRYRAAYAVWWSYFKSHETKIGMHSPLRAETAGLLGSARQNSSEIERGMSANASSS